MIKTSFWEAELWHKKVSKLNMFYGVIFVMLIIGIASKLYTISIVLSLVGILITALIHLSHIKYEKSMFEGRLQ